ncbi:MAG TPA: alkaline phosphatase [Desulfuromonadales bacterium]|nr:alkaline phosphatase [Desulfuromonadales bacterium]
MKLATYITFLISACLTLSACASGPARLATGNGDAGQVKNVIFMLSDGTTNEAWPLARWVKGERLASDEILSGAIRTYGADSIITDSAPGSTSYATGQKGSDKGISVSPWHVTIAGVEFDAARQYVPLATVLEGARLTGRATGVVATSNLQHATPADFTAHTHDRSDYTEIGEQQVYQNIDVLLAGGEQYLLPTGTGTGVRTDKENLVEVITSRGYTYVTNRDQMLAASGRKIFGMFAKDAMAYDIDRTTFAPGEPSLAEMTATALDTLSKSVQGSEKGFFLFVEGSKVDWGAHANDPAAVVSELLSYDRAVKVALDFAKRDGNTLLICVSDHTTGGLSIGVRSDPNYSTTDDDFVVGPLRKARLSGEGVGRLLGKDASQATIKEIFAQQWGITDLSSSEIASIQLAPFGVAQQNVIVAILSQRARIGWTTNGHTGGDPFLFSFGPGRISGLWENIDIGRYVAKKLGFTFAEINSRLFVEASSAFQAAGFSTVIDKNDATNPVLVVKKGGSQARLPISKNIVLVHGKSIELEGVVVLAEKLNKVYLPRQAIEIVEKELMF